jgi:endonuclease/exonuclease/phosphatase family metal-dependent hydrolase
MAAEFRHGAWFVTAAATADGEYEPFFYAHSEIAVSGKPVVILQRTKPGERDQCWMRMFPDFIPVDATAGIVGIEEVAARTFPKAGDRPNTKPTRRGGTPGALVFMHWNIGHFCHGRSCSTAIGETESNGRAAAFRGLFERYAPDVVGVCEYSAKFDIAGGRARTLPFAAFSCVDEGPQQEYQCNAMAVRNGNLSRLELRYYAKHRQKTYYIAEEVEIDGLKSVFVETHLDAYHDQIRELIERFRDVPRIVIAGDFNVPDVSWYEPFLAEGYSAANCSGFGVLPTHRAKRLADTDAIDNVFVRGWTIDDVAVGDYELALSDHRALACALTPKD